MEVLSMQCGAFSGAMTEEQSCDWEISSSLLFERHSVAISHGSSKNNISARSFGEGAIHQTGLPIFKATDFS